VFRKRDFVIQEAETMTSERQSATSQAEAERSTRPPSTFFSPITNQSVAYIFEDYRNTLQEITQWNNTSCERFPVGKQVKIYQIPPHHKGIFGRKRKNETVS
jgi:hypothetical protein